jgi:hypothetical protein
LFLAVIVCVVGSIAWDCLDRLSVEGVWIVFLTGLAVGAIFLVTPSAMLMARVSLAIGKALGLQ